MRVLSIAATTSWGVAVCLSLLLPRAPFFQTKPSPQVPAPPPAAAPAPTFAVAWQAVVGAVDGPQMAAGADGIFVADAHGVRAFSAAAGAPLWTTELAVSTPIAAGHGLVFVYADGSLRALDQQTGAARWSSAVETPAGGVTAVPGGLVAATGAVLRAWQPDGTPRWQIALTAPAVAPIAADGDRLFLALEDATLLSVGAADGKPRWQHRIHALPERLIAAGGRIYFGGADRAVYAFDQDGSEDPSWRFDVRAATIGAPAIDDRCVYVALMDNSIRAFRRGSGNLCWLMQLTLRPAAGPILLGEELAVLTATGSVAALDRQTGRTIGAPFTAPGVGPEGRPRLLAAAIAADGSIVALTVASGGQPTLTAFRRAAK
jgi:outer membrane protein assembly factor BamB